MIRAILGWFLHSGAAIYDALVPPRGKCRWCGKDVSPNEGSMHEECSKDSAW